MNCPYRKIVAEKWPGAEINSHGRFALTMTKDAKVMAAYLFESQAAAKASAPFYDSKVFDLQPTPVPDLKDDYEDRQYERRQKRVERFR